MVSALKGKKYEEIYGPLEASRQKAIRTVQATVGLSQRPNFSFRGWHHTVAAKQKISQTFQLKKYNKQINAAIKLLSDAFPELREILETKKCHP